MLVAIIVKNLAVIKKIELEFQKGLTVLTGETGAGKSILIDALLAILGGRVSKDIIREGEKSTLIEACFFICDNEKLSPYLSDNMLNISREIFRDGRNIVKINGSLSSTAVLREIAPRLISIHSQNDNQILFNQKLHYRFLDSFSNAGELYFEYLDLFNKYVGITDEINNAITENSDEKADYLRFLIDEIESAGIEENEEEQLKAVKQQIKDFEKSKARIMNASGALYESEESAYNLISEAENSIRDIEELVYISERLMDIKYELADLSEKISSSLFELETEYNDIDKLESRLDVLYRIKMKYGGSIAAVLDKLEVSKKELYQIENKEIILKALYIKKDEIEKELKEKAERLSLIREREAAKLSGLIEGELHDLMMPQARFEIRLQKEETYQKYGLEKVEFLFSANAGMGAQPLTKIASGGEISRVNLAIKSILSGIDSACAFVFDEIDAGISGRAAQKTAEKMYNLARDNQILCVTHLPQIAAMADNHVLVSKTEDGGETETNIEIIENEARATEIARMIGGVTVTDLTMENANEILRLAEEYKHTNIF